MKPHEPSGDAAPADLAEARVSAVIRGAPDVWRHLQEPQAQASFLAAAALHRVRPLVVWSLRRSGELPFWPEPVRRALADAERAEAALEIVRRLELHRLLQAFAAADIPVLLLKGAAMAYSLFPEPWLRPREDTDLLVRSGDATRAGEVLAASGYAAAVMQSGALVTHQRLYVRLDSAGRRHACDLHWKIANPAPFADLLSPDDILRDAVPVSIDDAMPARIPSRIHALLLACWHRVSHHQGSGDLLWLYDLHLLADGMSDAAAVEVLAIANRTGTGAVCASGLRRSYQRFATRMPGSLLAGLETPGGGAPPVSAVYLTPGARRVDLLAADLRALPGWRARARLVREHLFPPASYMLGVYPQSSRALLPALYLWRIARGVRWWFRRP